MVRLPRLLARLPASLHAKLSVGFFVIVALLLMLGLMGLRALNDANQRVDQLLQLQRNISVYRLLQHDATVQLYGVTKALLVPDPAVLESTLRQLYVFGYDVDRLSVAAEGDNELLDRVRADYKRFVDVVNRVMQRIRAGEVAAGRELQFAEAGPLAERLEREMNELVNRAEAEMLDNIDASHALYERSRWTFTVFGLASSALALALGFAISRSLTAPVAQMDQRLREIAAGNFERHVEVVNRDELGTLGENLNAMSDRLGELYRQLDRAKRDSESARQAAELARGEAEQAMRSAEQAKRISEDANRHKTQFLANVSHELRTPLTAIIGFSEVLKERMFGDLNEKQADYVEDIHTSGRHLLALINLLLDLAKIEHGKMDVDISRFDLSVAIADASLFVQERAQRNGIALRTELAADLGEIDSDELRLKEILVNLLSNAVKFTPRGGQIVVRAARLDGTVQISVSDTGIGIAPEHQSKIFEEFHQIKSSGPVRHEGTGLGLALNRRFAELLGGDIRVVSELGKGSTFTFTLPVRK